MHKPTTNIWSAILCMSCIIDQSVFSNIVVYECISLSEKKVRSGMYVCVYGLCVLG